MNSLVVTFGFIPGGKKLEFQIIMPIIPISQNLRLLFLIKKHKWIRDEQQLPHVEGRTVNIAAE